MNGIPQLASRAALLLGVSLCLFGCGHPETEETDNESQADPHSIQAEDLSTPDKTLAAVKAAAGNRNDAKMCRYFTPPAQKDQAAFMVIYGIRMQIEAERSAKQLQEKSDPKEKQRAAAIRALFQKHNLTEGNFPQVSIDRTVSLDEQKKEWRKLAEPIADHCEFYADFIQLMRKFAETPDARMIEGNAELKNLQIDGDHAQAEFVQSREGRERRSSIEFEKIEGQWRISEVPNWLY